MDHVVGLFRAGGIRCLRWPTSFFPLQSSLHYRIAGDHLEGTIKVSGTNVDLAEIRSVWYRNTSSFVMPSRLSAIEKRFARAEANSAFSGLMQIGNWFWVNHPDRVRIASSKALQLKVAQELGFSVPKTVITNDPDEVREFFEECDGRIVYKAFNSGFDLVEAKGCFTAPLSRNHLEKVHLVQHSAGIFQESIPKQVDLRITVIGRRVFAAEIHSQDHERAKHDWRAGEVERIRHCRHELCPEIERLCLRLMEYFGLAFGAIDMILTPDGRYLFLENNPTGQFGWIEGRTGLPLTAALAEILIAGRLD